MPFQTTREIGIDAAHRVTTHGSKCAHLHGHRYTILVTVEGGLGGGVETGMTIDFGFLKELMLKHVDGPADHGLILWEQDPWLPVFAPNAKGGAEPECLLGPFGKTWVIPCVPTAENLAGLWHGLLNKAVHVTTEGRCRVAEVVVRETPNCSASFGR